MSTHDQIVKAFQKFQKENKCLRFYQIGPAIFMAHIKGQNGQWHIACESHDTRFFCYSKLPPVVPVEKQVAVMEFLTLANEGMAIGNFELSLRHGDIRYKTSMDIQDGKMTPRMVKVLVYTNLFICDRYLPGLYRVLYANESPEAALRAIEDDDEAVDEKDEDAEALRKLLEEIDMDDLDSAD